MKQFFEEIRKKGQGNKFVKEDIIHVITRTNRAECGAVCQNDRLSAGHIWQTRSHVYGEVKCQAEVRSDVVIHNKLGNSNTCQGLLRRFVHKNTNNNEISPHNDMINKNVKTLFPYFPISFFPKKKVAFTLAETLITLGIIGVVAAITIPGLINNYKAKQLRTKYLKAYSTVAQAFKLMQNDDINTNIKDYEGGKFAKVFARYLSAATVCSIKAYDRDNGEKNSPGCYSYKLNTEFNNDGYKYLSKNGFAPDGYFNNGQLMLQDGTLIFFDDCPERENWKGCLVTVDINGFNQKPNRMGVDFFVFEVLDGTLHTLGDQDTSYRFHDDCDLDKPNQGGWTCSTNASSNSDYFKMVVKKIK